MKPGVGWLIRTVVLVAVVWVLFPSLSVSIKIVLSFVIAITGVIAMAVEASKDPRSREVDKISNPPPPSAPPPDD
jgi:hypothetical protein